LLSSTLYMRLFVALDIEPGVRDRIRAFADELRSLAPDVRWVSTESLHVTLKFIGEQPDAMAGRIEEALRAAVSITPFQLAFRGSGFFPSEKSARVFWIGIESGPELGALAVQIERALIPLGIEAESRAFNPHLTLARAGAGSGAPGHQRGDRPNRRFAALQAKLNATPPPEFGTMHIVEAFLYRSQLSSRGAQYMKIVRFSLTQ
jgi:RNA 2',3'-cyclic 3'-phosphodiesterase